jgi:hypothetical protein
MRGFDFSHGFMAIAFGGALLGAIVFFCLRASGFSAQETTSVFGALAWAWIPGFFIWGGIWGAKKKDENLE